MAKRLTKAGGNLFSEEGEYFGYGNVTQAFSITFCQQEQTAIGRIYHRYI
ncbi:MAG: hypothetical protein HQ578_07060 [Chloroflexi bacterium]|nr:hypothetical protein [Chloroflexota bacterium]